jgi:hypothetical protein
MLFLAEFLAPDYKLSAEDVGGQKMWNLKLKEAVVSSRGRGVLEDDWAVRASRRAWMHMSKIDWGQIVHCWPGELWPLMS